MIRAGQPLRVRRGRTATEVTSAASGVTRPIGHLREIGVDQPADQERPPEQLLDQRDQHHQPEQADGHESQHPAGGRTFGSNPVRVPRKPSVRVEAVEPDPEHGDDQAQRGRQRQRPTPGQGARSRQDDRQAQASSGHHRDLDV